MDKKDKILEKNLELLTIKYRSLAEEYKESQAELRVAKRLLFATKKEPAIDKVICHAPYLTCLFCDGTRTSAKVFPFNVEGGIALCLIKKIYQ